jgi:hypothetical protein
MFDNLDDIKNSLVPSWNFPKKILVLQKNIKEKENYHNFKDYVLN